MSGEGGHGASRPGAETVGSGGATLVTGTANHDEACVRLSRRGAGPAERIRVTIGEGPKPQAETDEIYDTGVYEELGLSEAGIVVSESVDTLESEVLVADDHPFVVCIDGVPNPAEFESRERLFRFLHALTRRVRAANGNCHVHLGVARSAPLVTKLEPLFDDVVPAENTAASSPTH